MRKSMFAVVGVGAMLLAACGSTTSSKTSSNSGTTPSKPKPAQAVTSKYGYDPLRPDANGNPQLILPHVGVASPTIRRFASHDQTFYHQIINPADWVHSNTFGGWIFVGPYTSGTNYQRIRDAKIAAVNSMELFTLEANYKQTWPTILNGFNYDAFGQKSVSQSLVTSFYKSAVVLGSGKMTADVPSQATIEESPVGKLTPKMMANTPAQPQNTTLGICVPHAFEIKDNGGGYAIKSGQVLGASITDEFFADYGNTNTVLPKSNALTNGVGSNPTNSCANFS